MCQVIDSDAVLAYVLTKLKTVNMAALRDLRAKLCPDFFLDIDSESIASAVFLHADLFAWESEGVVRRADDSQSLFASLEYIDASYGMRLPLACRERIEVSIQRTT
ncbi:MAG: hypothetical protein U9N87_06545 [Planctomycetota bacterium]|nr:hypothetical protein [Planctomycetota bacterium]